MLKSLAMHNNIIELYEWVWIYIYMCVLRNMWDIGLKAKERNAKGADWLTGWLGWVEQSARAIILSICNFVCLRWSLGTLFELGVVG